MQDQTTEGGDQDSVRRPPAEADADSEASAPQPPPPPRRIRLSLACNQCRKRKVRCDAEKPKCRNCWLRDEECTTTDPRRPNAGPGGVVRRWATRDGLLPGQNPEATHRNQASVPKQMHMDGAGAGSASPMELFPTPQTSSGASGSVSAGTPSAASVSASATASAETQVVYSGANQRPVVRAQSWVAKAYQLDSLQGGGGGSGGNHADADADNHPDVVVNTCTDEQDSHKVKYLGGSSLQSLSVFLDMYLRRRGLQPISQCFRSGMRYAEEFENLPLAVNIPDLPAYTTISSHVNAFFSRVWPIVPVVDRASIVGDFGRLHEKQHSHPGGLQRVLSTQDAPALVCVLSVLCIGADETAGTSTSFGNEYLTAAYSLYGHLVAQPYLSSVQALVLLGVALRGRSKDGQCWQLTGQAIRIAHSIGLHRCISSRPKGPLPRTFGQPRPDVAEEHQLSIEARVWWSCYALERLMELETGRPSAISEHEIDQVDLPKLPEQHSAATGTDMAEASSNNNNSSSTIEPQRLFTLWVALSRIMGQISEHIYRRHTARSGHLLYETGRLDQLLLEWLREVPEGFKPGQQQHDAPNAGRGGGCHLYHHIAAFLSFQYYQAQIILFRASLMFPMAGFLDEVRRQHAAGNVPSQAMAARLLQSQGTCVAAARATAAQVLEMADAVDGGGASVAGSLFSRHLFAPTQPFMAAAVLALHVLKNPGKRMVRSDAELLVGTTEYVESFYRGIGQSRQFVEGCERLRESILAAVAGDGPGSSCGSDSRRGSRAWEGHGARQDTAAASTASGAVETPGRGSGRYSSDLHRPVGMDSALSGPGYGPPTAAPSTTAWDFFEPYEGITLEELWMSMSSDFMLGQQLDFANPAQ